MQNKAIPHPTGAENPALEFFGHLLADDGLYPAADVMIFFNKDYENSGAISDIAVVYLPRNYIKSKCLKNHPIFEMVAAKFNLQLFNSCSGNFDFANWMKFQNLKSPPPHDPDTYANFGFGPDEDFQCFKSWGFSSIEEAERAITEFARIRECAWARDRSVAPESLVKDVVTRNSQSEARKIKNWIYAEETRRCSREFEGEVKRRMASGEMKKCPKNVDICFQSMRLKPETADTNPQYLEFKEQWDALREKMIGERDVRINERDCHTEEEIQAYQSYQIEEEIRSYEYEQKKKIFDEIVSQKISSNEWVVPEGVCVSSTGLLILAGANHWDENAPVNILRRQLNELRKKILGE